MTSNMTLEHGFRNHSTTHIIYLWLDFNWAFVLHLFIFGSWNQVESSVGVYSQIWCVDPHYNILKNIGDLLAKPWCVKLQHVCREAKLLADFWFLSMPSWSVILWGLKVFTSPEFASSGCYCSKFLA